MRVLHRLMDVLVDAAGVFLPLGGGALLWAYWTWLTVGDRLILGALLIVMALVIVGLDRVDAVAQEYARERETRKLYAQAIRRQAEIEAASGTDLPGRGV